MGQDGEGHYNELELEMLGFFYSILVHDHQTIFLHWNMSDDNFGYRAIERHLLGGYWN